MEQVRKQHSRFAQPDLFLLVQLILVIMDKVISLPLFHPSFPSLLKFNLFEKFKGMYFSDSLLYAMKYSTKNAKNEFPFVISMVLPGNTFPIVEPPYITHSGYTQENSHGFLKKPCKLGYQSHFTIGSLSFFPLHLFFILFLLLSSN